MSSRRSGRDQGRGAAHAGYPPVVALDVGTTKVACLVGELGAGGELARLRGVAKVPARGMHKGVVVDLDEAAESVREAVSQAGKAARAVVRDAFVGVAGSHVLSLNRKVAVTNPASDGRIDRELERELVERLKQVVVPEGFRLIHALPRGYVLDGQDGIRRPAGMWARRVELLGHLVYGDVNAMQNLVSVVEAAGVEVKDLVLEPLASSRACLTDEDRLSGVILVDIGGGTTDVALFTEGRLAHSAVLPVGGNHVTRDISVALRVPLPAAEEIKLQYAHAQSHLVEDIEMERVEIPFPGEGERRVSFSRKYLARVVEARLDEVFTLVMRQVQDSGYLSSIAAGIVITGGSSLLEGIEGLAANSTGLPARLGVPLAPAAVDIPRDPVYATAVGLLLHGSEQTSAKGPARPPEPSSSSAGFFNEVLAKVKGWFKASGGS